jgi:hypothetical protein
MRKTIDPHFIGNKKNFVANFAYRNFIGSKIGESARELPLRSAQAQKGDTEAISSDWKFNDQ